MALVEPYVAELSAKTTRMRSIFMLPNIDNQPRGETIWKERLQRHRYSYKETLLMYTRELGHE